MPRDTTIEELQSNYELASGPMRPLLEEAGTIIARKLEERGTAIEDMPSDDLVAILHTALIEAGAKIYPGQDAEALNSILADAFDEIRLSLGANADGGDALN